ncbi:unnamed protein product, partial [Arabidopsis halleri]
MMKSDLPLDLVDEILSRVPATSLIRLRATCRRWNALFKNKRFTEKHFRIAATKDPMVLMLNEYRVCRMSVNLNVAPPSIEFKGALGLKDSHSNSKQVDIVQVFHCDGLLLCKTKKNRLVVWNPCLGETRRIKLKVDYKIDGSCCDYYGTDRSRFALGYIQNNKCCRSYKILRWCEIYEFSSDSWRVIDDVLYSPILYGYTSVSSLKGNTYWLADDEKEGCKLLLSFDFTAEKFKRLCLPLFQNHGRVTLSVGREEQLSVLNWSYNTSAIEMWVTNKIDAESELLWSKSFTVNYPIGPNFSEIFTTLLID